MADVAKRNTFKLCIVRAARFASNENEFKKASRTVIKARLENLISYWDNFMEHHCSIMAVTGEKEFEFQENELIDAENLFISTKAKYLEQIENIDRRTTNPEAGNQNQQQVIVTNRSEIPLPAMNIPTFTGKPTDWMEFHSLFVAHIDSKDRLTASQKFQYLKSKLDGEAAQLIRNYPLTDANYALALEALTARYRNDRVIANAHLKLLFNQSSVKIESSASLRKLIDTTNDCVRALNGLNIETETWDPLLVFIVTQKLDTSTILEWERSLTTSELPKMKELTTFIETRCRALESVSSTRSTTSSTTKEAKESRSSATATAFHVVSEQMCVMNCNEKHKLHVCSKFLALCVSDRNSVVKDNKLCYNCLNGHHSSRICRSPHCRNCSRKHHTLLHTQAHEQSSNTVSANASASKADDNSASSLATNNIVSHHQLSKEPVNQECSVLLATACVVVKGADGTHHKVRVLLDSGSQASFVSEDCVRRLKLKRLHAVVKVSGLGTSDAGTTRGMICTQISSQYDSNVQISVDAFVLNRITSSLPQSTIPTNGLVHLNNIDLADEMYFKPAKIDLLLGADIYAQILLPEILRGNEESPIAQRTLFGWVVSGKVNARNTNVVPASLHVNTSLDTALQRFWELESVADREIWNADEKYCDDHFKNTFQRNDDGKIIVELPLKENWKSLGQSRPSAVSRLKQLESRFRRNPELRSRYIEFMREYIQLGHMKMIPKEMHNKPNCYYIPHHAVIKEESTTTKLRVVFDASNKTTSGLSLNDVQMVGPTLQNTLHVILLKFRKHKIAITADITKMYRQVLMHPKHQDLQRIVWRESETDVIDEFWLATVTYGTASAPFLAIRSLIECARTAAGDFPVSSDTILHDMYVDDLITGADNVSEAIIRQKEISDILLRGGFDLRKWTSNSVEVLKNIPQSHRECKESLSFLDGQCIKALGIRWYPQTDTLGYKVELHTINSIITKRNVLADTARLFDPLGFLSPVIISAKIFMQRLWILEVGWDEILPEEICNQWITYRNDLKSIERVQIPRWLGTSAAGCTQLHGFCDASELAYAAVIYARTEDADGNVKVNILSSKTKVSPVKGKRSIAELELCGAMLLAQLMVIVKKALAFEDVATFAWTDSLVVLAWLRKLPCTWATFVANRVASIQSTLDATRWKFVPGKDNPADIASRGILASQIVDHSAWWRGPSWLEMDECTWPVIPKNSNLITDENRKHQSPVVLATSLATNNLQLVDKYSSLVKLKRITAIVFRFVQNSRRSLPNRSSGPIKPIELDAAQLFWIKQAQSIEFNQEINCMRNNIVLSSKSQLLSLNPFIDVDGLLRVGGRIDAAALPYCTRHPIILPPKSRITEMVLVDLHLALKHAGVQLMIANLRLLYWLPCARSYLRNLLHRCLPCFKQKKQVCQQQMGNLPSLRLTPARAFLHSGVDYAGPINLRVSELRNSKMTKGYIAVFVCLVTRALHLELVSDLTSDTFIAAFRRFVSRRGRCSVMMSDNGTNFVGANRELKGLTEILQSQYLANQLTNEGTEWKLIPPSAPHFGGIWEAGVKSVKHHLRRVIGATHLTFEKMTTLLTQIEACLNSRPLTPLTDDVNDVNALTPGHFLLGEQPSTGANPNVLDIPINRLSQWQHIQRIQQDFWLRWQREYIGGLQQRPKWRQAKENVKINDMVIVMDECLPPTQWPLGRITAVHPGKDDHVRVVSIKYNGKIISRPIQKICVLPIEN